MTLFDKYNKHSFLPRFLKTVQKGQKNKLRRILRSLFFLRTCLKR